MNITVGLVQYSTGAPVYLPYSVGLLQASLSRAADPSRFHFLLPRVFPLPLAQEVAALREVDVLGVSLYVWNEQRSLALARQLKEKHPQILTVFGGPQVPDKAETWLRQHPYVDVACHGEGEDIFLALLEQYPERRWQAIPGLSWLDSGQFKHTPPAPKRRDLDAFPSPFLNGVFEPLMAAYPKQRWASTWETNRGCPFSCVFCDWGSAIATRVNRFNTHRLLAELDWLAAKCITHIFCADANFGILPRDLELAEYAAQVKLATGQPGSLMVQNAKNLPERSFEIQKRLIQVGLDKNLTLALQSLHPPTLRASGRQNISLRDFETLQKRLMAEGIHTYTDLILGLPEESYTSFTEGIATLIEKGQYHAFQFFNADILPNAPMADPAFIERYGIETATVPFRHGFTPLEGDPDGIVEVQQMVIATASLPRADWVRARCFAWLTELLFFNPGCLRMPLLLLHAHGQINFKPLIEAFMAPEPVWPTLHWIWRFFEEKALGMIQGEPEYSACPDSSGALNWVGPCHALLEMLARTQRLPQFYQEAKALLKPFAQTGKVPLTALDDALFLSSSQILLQFLQEPLFERYTLSWNVWDYLQGVLSAQKPELHPESVVFVKTWRGEPFKLRRLQNSANSV